MKAISETFGALRQKNDNRGEFLWKERIERQKS